MAFGKRVQFEPIPGTPHTSYARHGTVTIPISEGTADEEKPGWIVDGQQRSAAIHDARVEVFKNAMSLAAFAALRDPASKTFMTANEPEANGITPP